MTFEPLSAEVIREIVDEIFSAARPPRSNVCVETAIQRGGERFIVSGGGIDFMRPWTEKVYGIPPEQVVGSYGLTRFEMGKNGILVLRKLPGVEFIDDGPGKPVGINRFIGRRPVFVFGNSDGDQQMLEWTAAGDGARFTGIIHHTDAVREFTA